MLCLTRREGEKIVIGDNIVVTVVEVSGDRVRIGVDAPKEISVHREELQIKIATERESK
jgi:carbon storage regulator